MVDRDLRARPLLREPMARVREPGELRRQIGAWHDRGLRVAFVPTMGALHEGHLSLVREAHRHAERVVVSIFVNPTQFGPDEDFESYPRDLEADCGLLAREGCNLVFTPTVEALYPGGSFEAGVPGAFVEVSGPSAGFEADERPGHFRGVATVVAKLFNLVGPDVAIFGEKDAQQLAVVRLLVRDLCLPIEIVGAPIVRESDGLALSSRNVYLDTEQRQAARVLSRSLFAAKESIDAGERDAEVIRRKVREHLDSEPMGTTDYVAVVDAETFSAIERLEGRCVIAIAFRLGRTRLLDNLHLELPCPGSADAMATEASVSVSTPELVPAAF